MKEEKASITLEDLRNQGIAQKIAEFTTHYAPNSGGERIMWKLPHKF